MKTSMLIGILACAAVILLAFASGCIENGSKPGNVTPVPSGTAGKTTVAVMYANGVGPMPMLLSTSQVDGYIAWQPFASIATEARIGNIIAESQDLPPDGKWKNHPCCVLTVRDDLLARNPDLVNAISAQTILADRWITENPDKAAEDLAEWLVGKGNFTYGNVSVSSVAVLNKALPTVNYTTEMNDQWITGTHDFVSAQRDLGYITGQLKNSSNTQWDSILFAKGPYEAANRMIAEGKIKTPPKESRPVTLGNLKGDMHGAAMIIAVKEWQYFNDKYSIAIKPRDLTAAKPEVADLIVNGEPVAEIRLVAAGAGPELMQMESTDTIQVGFAGAPPAIGAIDKGAPIKILHPINTEGSGVVITTSVPVKDWNGFIAYAAQRTAEGKPMKIAAPSKGSIQDVMLRYALEKSGVTVKESS